MTSRHSSGRLAAFKRKDGRRRINNVHRLIFAPKFAKKTVRSSARPQEMHVSSTGFPHRVFAAVLVAFFGCAHPLLAGVRDTPTPPVFRVFLKDGGTLVSFGEFARVSDRVVIPVPLGDVHGEPRLHVLTIPESAIDWERTETYAQAVRARRYAETRGEDDFTLLVGQVTAALNQLVLMPDPARRLAMAEEARRNLAVWPQANYGYKAGEVAKLVQLFDETIAELRAAAGHTQFDLSLVATTEPPAPLELMAPPDVQSSLELAFTAATLAVDPVEKMALMRELDHALRYAPQSVPWVTTLHTRVVRALAIEARTDKAYTDLSSSLLKLAEARAANADVRGLQNVISRALKADDTLGRKRPGQMASLLATLDLRLDDARRRRLARDAWAVRVELIKDYRDSIAAPVERLRSFRKWLDHIRDLSGPDPKYLRPLQDRTRLAQLEIGGVTPPAEAQAAHQLLVAALQMTRQAATLRWNAVSSNDNKLAWDASAAAAGAITLTEQAAGELQRLIASQPTR